MSKDWGRIVINPRFSISFYPRKLGRIGREIEATCENGAMVGIVISF